MKIDISRAQIRTAAGEGITAVENKGGELLLHFEGNGYRSVKQDHHIVRGRAYCDKG